MASALSGVCQALATTNPYHADRLLADAERTAQSVEGWEGWEKAWALSDVARTLAAIDPNRAERIARSITMRG